MEFVLFRSGKVRIIGPFTSIEDAADHMGRNRMMGYQILPLTPTEEVIPPLPMSEQTREKFEKWAAEFSWDHTIYTEDNAKVFANEAVGRFAGIFSIGVVDMDTGRRGIKSKILLIKAVHKFTAEYRNGKGLGLREAKMIVDEIEREMVGNE